jgi:hypothetical protein
VKEIGVVEYWSVGVIGKPKDRGFNQYSSTPSLQYSSRTLL